MEGEMEGGREGGRDGRWEGRREGGRDEGSEGGTIVPDWSGQCFCFLAVVTHGGRIASVIR
jgi:hypothetical protein